MAVKVRYPGRICLLGEHCDWAGGASLVVPLPLSVVVETESVQTESVQSGLTAQSALAGELLHGRWPSQGAVSRAGGPLRFVAAAAAALTARGHTLTPTHLNISADLPAGRGFSSSAAVTLASLDALARHSGVVLQTHELAELAYHVEHDLLGIQCGRLDPLACASAQPTFFRWQVQGLRPLQAHLSPVHPGARFHLIAACFPRERDTPGILATLQDAWRGDLRDALQASRARSVYTALAAFGDAATVGARALMAGDAQGLGDCLCVAQQVYEDHLATGFVALRAPALWRTCQQLREQGALGAKFSGAGGDGSVIALFPAKATAIEAVADLKRRQLSAWYCPFGEDDS